MSRRQIVGSAGMQGYRPGRMIALLTIAFAAEVSDLVSNAAPPAPCPTVSGVCGMTREPWLPDSHDDPRSPRPAKLGADRAAESTVSIGSTFFSFTSVLR